MKFARVLIYVGPPKTGSSTIETFAWRNRDELTHQGYFIPLTGVSNNQHIGFAAAFADYAPSERRKRLLSQAGIPPGGAGLRRRKLTADLADELAIAPPCHTLLFMSEAFFPATPPEIKGYRDIFRLHASRFECLMYLRRQDRWLASRSLQNRKVGNQEDSTLHLGQPQRFASNVCNWLEASDQTHVRRQDGEFLVRGSLQQDFCTQIGADCEPLDMTELRLNPSPFQEQLELVDVLNKRLSDLPFERQAQSRKRFLARTSEILGGSRIQFPKAEALAVFQSFNRVNTWLRRTFHPEGPRLFFNENFEEYAEAPMNDKRYSSDQLAKVLIAFSPGAQPANRRSEALEQIVRAFLTEDTRFYGRDTAPGRK